MLRLAIVAALLLAVLPAHGNLGDTVVDLTKRYGKFNNYSEANAKTPFGAIQFVAGPFEMIAFLYKTVEVGARVQKTDKTAFTPAEISIILNADATTAWVPTKSDDPASQEWIRADKATATYDTAARMLIFTTPAMEQALHTAAPAPPLTNSAPAQPRGNFAAPAPTTWASPVPLSTNAAPATTTGPLPQP